MSEILVESEHTVAEFRQILDKQSGIPGLPDMIVHEPKPTTLETLSQMRALDPNVGLQYRVQNAIDGMVELVPGVVRMPMCQNKNEQ